jgi:hypothetical protein
MMSNFATRGSTQLDDFAVLPQQVIWLEHTGLDSLKSVAIVEYLQFTHYIFFVVSVETSRPAATEKQQWWQQ